MKNLFILAFMLSGLMTTVNAQTTIRIALPNGETETFQVKGDVNFPCCGEVIEYGKGTATAKRWSFPVYWTNNNGSGSFIMSGNTTNMDIIINFLENYFDINIT